uniref:RNA helicase n=1 Tax=Tetradesmus obliquus TaxID=3088 RepID=A0A383W704_TETOB|eukprot:jgi/Sobl393_1/16515/SZX72774.1
MFQKPGSLSKAAFGVKFDGQQQQQHHGTAAAAAEPAAKRPKNGLPVESVRRELLYLVESHATVVVVGETGCGKTTQIPRFLHEAGWTADGYQVVCTQPRRVAAVSIAQRVADEMGVAVGTTVGYGVRFEDASNQATTRIKYVTDGLLLREMMDDPLLTKYSVIMVDEAHERSLATDTLLGLLKKVQRRRPDLRLVISSATLEVDRLVAFFDSSTVRGKAAAAAAAGGGGAPSRTPAVVSIPGRVYPVQVHYLLDNCSDYVQAAVQTVVDIHREDVPGDVLVFLTGQEEVESAVRMLDEEARRLARSRLQYKLMAAPMYAGLPGAQQRLALEPAARGVRKVVVATNIAETSLTIEGIVYVVDCCFVKQRAYNPIVGLESLLVAPTSKASCMQRAGRAGRVRPGHAFRLCTEESWQQLLPKASVPEMQRSDLAGLLLQLKALGIDNIMRFDWLAPPPAEAAVRGLELLHALGALDGDAKLTPSTGTLLAELPLEPQLGAALLAAATRFGCCQELLTLAGMLSVPAVWASPAAVGGKRALEEAKAKFAAAEGDLVAFLNVHRAWLEHGKSHRWSSRNGIHQHGMLRAAEVSQQLCRKLKRMGLDTNSSCEGDVDKVLKAVTAGLFMNAAQFDHTEYDPRASSDAGSNVYRLLRHMQPGRPLKLRIHASSVLARTRPQLLLFLRCQQNDEGWYEMQAVTAVEPDWLTELAPGVFQKL